MTKSKIAILFSLLSITCLSCRFPTLTFTPGYTEKECEQIEANLDKLEIGMTRTEVISLIGKKSRDIIHLNPVQGFFFQNKRLSGKSGVYVKTRRVVFLKKVWKEKYVTSGT